MKKLTLILSVLISCAVVLASCGTPADAAYLNGDFGIGFVPAGGLEMADDAEIAAYASDGVMCEMMATDPDTGSAVVVSVEEALFESAEAYLEAVKGALGIDGFDVVFGEIGTVKVAGVEFAIIEYSVSADGIDATMATLATVKGDGMLVINASYSDPSQLDEFLECFVAVK